MFIDVKTAYFLLGFLYLVMPTSAYFYLKNFRSRTVSMWCFGGVLNGLALVMISFRPYMLNRYPDFITFTLLNTLIVAGYSLRIQSLRIEMQRGDSNYLLYGFILMFMIGYHACVVFGNDLGPRVIFALVVISILLFRLAWTAKLYQAHFKLHRIGFIASIYGLLGVALAVKVIMLVMGLESYDILEQSTINTIMTVTGILAVIYSNLGYIALVLAKVEKNYEATLAKNKEMVSVLDKRNASIKDLMRMQAFSAVGTYGATVVHEVLQSLTALRFGIENLESHLVKNNSDQESKARLAAVRKPAEKAIGVIESLRNFMVERNIDVKPVMLSEVLKSVVQLHQARVDALRVSISIQSSIVSGYVLADEHQLERVLFNIINNSLDAIERKTQSNKARNIIVKVQYIQQNQFILLKVIDSGDGIQNGKETKIFDWMETHSSGMGIGLALSRMLVESWQGTISAYSANANLDGLSGAVFELKLKSAK